ncbi:FtsW/RodA/SpoVE family cell cycle protein [Candidatus Soleaferrea massiliensis]|uniref:FtsW/RodA/SpoVE family cell cycle protein n=1 Tax=Candidatus Soleaferrea massiliensis TaxID=1470354 RepID=UPI00058D7AD8|nr:FtsW/RodA/SpoVE family cell cycle protein [Candidatus Soleaferrea massiliensis]
MKKIFSSIAGYIKGTDKALFFLCILTSGFAVLILAGLSISFPYLGRMPIVQGVAAVGGLVVAIIISKIDYRTLGKLWKFYVPVLLALVALTFIIGVQNGTADDKAWIPLPFGLSFQPSEWLKIAFILTFSYHVDAVRDEINKLKNVLLLGLHGIFPVLLIHFQGDDGTALIFAFIFVAMLFAAGLSWKYIAAAAGVLVVALPILWFKVFDQDQRDRFLILFNPNSDTQGLEYQQINGKISIGSGQVFGNGLFSGEHRYVPEIQNDFVFSFIGEALGFLGCLLVVGLITALCVKILLVSRASADWMGKSICVGVFMMLASQTIINIGMNLGVLPVIGVTLPFFSAGGSSVVTVYMGIGLVLSVYMHNKTTLFME